MNEIKYKILSALNKKSFYESLQISHPFSIPTDNDGMEKLSFKKNSEKCNVEEESEKVFNSHERPIAARSWIGKEENWMSFRGEASQLRFFAQFRSFLRRVHIPLKDYTSTSKKKRKTSHTRKISFSSFSSQLSFFSRAHATPPLFLFPLRE